MIASQIRDRYLRDPLQIRLGGLAADLARVASFSKNLKNRNAVAGLLEESKYFAEWTADDASLEIQELLVELQMIVVRWERQWITGHMASDMQEQAQQWADRLLELSGLAC